jgi:hypothetical protein
MMNLKVELVDVWYASIDDKPGGLGKVLAGLKDAGVDLDFVIARRTQIKPGSGVVFVTPLRGDAEVAAANTLGFNVARSIKSVRVEGDNRAGIGSDLTEKLAAAGINLHGFSGAVIGERFILYIGLDTEDEAKKAAAIIKKL